VKGKIGGLWSQPVRNRNPEKLTRLNIIYLLVPPGLIDSNVSAPSWVEKKVPHFGHLTRVSFDTDAHPKEKQMTIDIIMNISIFAFIRSPHLLTAQIYCHLKIMSSISFRRESYPRFSKNFGGHKSSLKPSPYLQQRRGSPVEDF